jgi:hypothetical protein
MKVQYIVKPPFMVYLRGMGFEQKTEENLNCREFNNDIVDLRSLRLNVE